MKARHESHSQPYCAAVGFCALAVFLFCVIACAGAAEEKKHKVVEIKVREMDAAAAAKISYARQIKAIIVDNCLECHSTEDHKGGLDATTVEIGRASCR